MGIRGVTPGRGSEARGPEPSKRISPELKTNVNDTKAVVQRAVLARGGAKIEGYTKGSVNPAEDRKAGIVFKGTPKAKTQKI